MARIPTETYHDFLSGTGTDPISPTELALLKARVSALETSSIAMQGQISILSTKLDSAIAELGRREFVFKSTSALSDVNGGLWKICGLYRTFETLNLKYVRGYSLEWPTSSSWQIIALRASGTVETHNIGQFTFEVVPTFNTLRFVTGDVLGVLVRNFTSTADLTTDDNPAVCSMVFEKATI